MGATYDDREIHEYAERHTNRTRWTTIVLDEQADGRWLATQAGVSVQGHGETAADAAAEYCRKISASGDA